MNKRNQKPRRRLRLYVFEGAVECHCPVFAIAYDQEEAVRLISEDTWPRWYKDPETMKGRVLTEMLTATPEIHELNAPFGFGAT